MALLRKLSVVQCSVIYFNFIFQMRSIYLGSTERALSLLEGNGEIVRATQASTSIEPWPPLDQKEAGA